MVEISSISDIGAMVRSARKRLGLRQSDLAAACGTSVRFLVELERGKPTAQVGNVLRVLQMLGIRVHLDPGEVP